jgi:methanogenic corrinoid protein MtbC1
MAGAMLGEELSRTLFDHIRSGRRRAALDLVAARVRSGSPVQGRTVTLALAGVQRRVGDAWQRGELNVADEHTATAVVDDCLGLVAAHLPDPPSDRSIALVCAEGEWHVTPARMAALLLRVEGWHVTFLGGSTPPEHVHATLDLLRPDHVAVSCTLPLALPGAARVADVAHELGLRVLGGGRAFGTTDHRAHSLGLDGWAPDVAVAARMFDAWLRVLPTPGSRTELDGEELSLELNEQAIVEAAMVVLASGSPTAESDDRRQLARTRRVLGSLLEFARVALVCDDDSVFTDFTPWLREVLTSRGVEPGALREGLDVLADLADGLPRTQRLLRLPI